jgi:hypothetical protein
MFYTYCAERLIKLVTKTVQILNFYNLTLSAVCVYEYLLYFTNILAYKAIIRYAEVVRINYCTSYPLVIIFPILGFHLMRVSIISGTEAVICTAVAIVR